MGDWQWVLHGIALLLGAFLFGWALGAKSEARAWAKLVDRAIALIERIRKEPPRAD